MDNTEKEKHLFMITDKYGTRLATYKELQEVQESLNNIAETMVMMSKTMTELTRCVKELANNFVDTTKSIQEDIDKLKGRSLQMRNSLCKEWEVGEGK